MTLREKYILRQDFPAYQRVHEFCFFSTAKKRFVALSHATGLNGIRKCDDGAEKEADR